MSLIQRRRLARQIRRTVAALDALMTETGRLEFDRRAWMADEVADDIDPLN